MPDTNTPIFNMVLVEVGASTDTWGTKLNSNFSIIDTAMGAASMLTRLLTVDGTGSGLDADKLRGTTPTAYGLNLLTRVDGGGARDLLDVEVGINVQAWDADLDAFAALDATAGLIEKTGAAAYARRALGVGAGTSVLTRADGDGRYPLAASGAFSGVPTAPTAPGGTNTTQLATTAFVTAAVAGIINAAPGALDTLDELAAALGDDANFAASTATSLAGKQPIDADLTSIAALVGAANKMLYATGASTWALADLTAAGRALLDDADAAAQLVTLGITGVFAPLNAPTFTGIPAAPTAAADTATTQVATTAFVDRLRDLPRTTGGLARGYAFATNGNPTFDLGPAAGSMYAVYNDSAAAITLTQGAGMTLRLGGTATTGSRTLAPRGLATIWFNAANEAVVQGSGVT